MNKIVVSFGKTEKTRGMTFVALSRVRCLEDILLNHVFFDEKRFLSIKLPQYIRDFDIKTAKLIENTKKMLIKINKK